MISKKTQIFSVGAALAAWMASPASAVTDGFGDGDRNNNGTITAYDSDSLVSALDAGDTGIVWASTFGFTSSNTGDRKNYISIIDDSTGDVDSPGMQSGYALGVEGKGSNGSFAGFLNNSVAVGPNVGDRVDVSFDFRGWSQSGNPTNVPVIGELRFGIYQDTDNQFGQSANTGRSGASVVWGADTGENDGDWVDSDPGPIGDKGYYARVPIGLAADPIDSRIVYENNAGRYLEGSGVENGGDTTTIANPNNVGEGPGGSVFTLFEPHNVKMSIVRTAGSLEVQTYYDDVLVLSNEIDPLDANVMALGTAPDSFDYIGFRNSQDYDYIIDNVSIEAIPVPEPASAALLGAMGLAFLGRGRRG